MASDHLVEIDLDVEYVYLRDEYKQSVKANGITISSINNCLETVKSGLSNGCQMFLNINDMYIMLNENPKRFLNPINGDRNFLIIAIPDLNGVQFMDVVTLGVNEGLLTQQEAANYRSQMQFHEYVPLNNILPQNMLYIDTIDFVTSYCQLQPFTIVKNGMTFIFKHKLTPNIDRAQILNSRIFFERHRIELSPYNIYSPIDSVVMYIDQLRNFERNLPFIYWGVSVCEYLIQILSIGLFNLTTSINSTPRQLIIKRQRQSINNLLTNQNYLNKFTSSFQSLKMIRDVILIIMTVFLEFDESYLTLLQDKYLDNRRIDIFDINVYDLRYLFGLSEVNDFTTIPLRLKFQHGIDYRGSNIESHDVISIDDEKMSNVIMIFDWLINDALSINQSNNHIDETMQTEDGYGTDY